MRSKEKLFGPIRSSRSRLSSSKWVSLHVDAGERAKLQPQNHQPFLTASPILRSFFSFRRLRDGQVEKEKNKTYTQQKQTNKKVAKQKS